MRFFEFQTPKIQKPLSTEQARLRSLKDQAKRAQAAIKAERARQKIQAGQIDLAKVESIHNKKSQSYKTMRSQYVCHHNPTLNYSESTISVSVNREFFIMIILLKMLP